MSQGLGRKDFNGNICFEITMVLALLAQPWPPQGL